MKPSVEYPGYYLSAEGLHPLESKKNAIVHAPETQNIKQLGLLPLLCEAHFKFSYLLRDDVKWNWT